MSESFSLSDDAISSAQHTEGSSSVEGVPVSVPIPVPKSSDSESGSGSGSRPKRKTSFSTPSKSSLPTQVSRWKRQHAEKLGIFYAKRHAEGLKDLKEKLNGTIHELTKEQAEYTEIIFNYLTLNLAMDHFTRQSQINASIAKDEIALVEVKLQKLQTKKNLKELETLAKHNMLEFIWSLKKLLCEMRNYKKDKPEKEQNQKQIAAERFMTGLFSTFARLCFLKAIDCTGKSVYHAVWDNLHGETVTSLPDLRLYKCGLNCEFSEGEMVSVVEVKPKYMYNYNPELMPPPRKKYKGCPRISSDSEAEVTNESAEAIELELHDKVLGQHAGELLLDLHVKYRGKEEKSYEENKIMNLLGMIVEGSSVIFTMLELKWGHYQKLKSNTDLACEDKAYIYYTKSKDLLWERDRKVLIENLVSLNNLEYF